MKKTKHKLQLQTRALFRFGALAGGKAFANDPTITTITITTMGGALPVNQGR